MRRLGIAVWLTLALAGVLSGCVGGPECPVVAKVNGGEITLDEFAAQIAFLGLGNDPAALAPDLRQAVLDSLVRRHLIVSKGLEMGLRADSPKVLLEVEQASHGNDNQRFLRNLQAQGLSPEQWKLVLSKEVLAKLSVDAALTSRILVSAEEIKAYYQIARERFDRPERILAQHAVLPTREMAAKLLAQVAGGQDMGKAAEAMGAPLDGGGQPSWLSRGHMPPELEDKVFALKKGKVAGPLASAYGFHVIRIIEKRPARRLSVSQAAPEIKRHLAAQRKEEMATEWIADLLGKANVWFDPGFRATGRIGRTIK